MQLLKMLSLTVLMGTTFALQAQAQQFNFEKPSNKINLKRPSTTSPSLSKVSKPSISASQLRSLKSGVSRKLNVEKRKIKPVSLVLPNRSYDKTTPEGKKIADCYKLAEKYSNLAVSNEQKCIDDKNSEFETSTGSSLLNLLIEVGCNDLETADNCYSEYVKSSCADEVQADKNRASEKLNSCNAKLTKYLKECKDENESVNRSKQDLDKNKEEIRELEAKLEKLRQANAKLESTYNSKINSYVQECGKTQN